MRGAPRKGIAGAVTAGVDGSKDPTEITDGIGTSLVAGPAAEDGGIARGGKLGGNAATIDAVAASGSVLMSSSGNGGGIAIIRSGLPTSV